MIIKFDTTKLLKRSKDQSFTILHVLKLLHAVEDLEKDYLSTYFMLAKALQKQVTISLFLPHFNNQGLLFGILSEIRNTQQNSKKG